MIHYVYGDKSRIFINTALGCEAKCQYCYLPNLGAEKVPQYISAEKALELLQQLSYFVPGQKGTILSIGCYSECWDKRNKAETFKVISKIAQMGNYIQLATKKQILLEELQKLDSLALYKNQIGIYISVPTLTHSRQLEPGTDSVEKRLMPLQFVDKISNLYCALYIKPVLEGITILDCEKYEMLLKQQKIPAVVGSFYKVTERLNDKILVGEGHFDESCCDENKMLIERLQCAGEVYTHSIDIIRKMQEYEI